jgi:hypothetical protein
VVGWTTLPPSIQVSRLDSSGEPASKISIPIRGSDQVTAAAVDPSGNLWIVTAPFFNSGQSAPAQALIVKVDPTATSVLFTARFGGTASNGETGINAIAFHADGNVYLGGSTNQTDFPATAGAFMTQIGKADLPSGYVLSTVPRQGFVAKFSPSFAVIYASLIGGVSPKLPSPCNGTCYTTGATNWVSAIAVDAAGVVTVAGATSALIFNRSGLIDQIEVNRNYQKSDLLQIIRILKNYDFLKEPQLELFKPRRSKRKPASP